MRHKPLFRSTSARLTASFSAVLVLSFALAATLAGFSTRSLAEQQVREHIEEEMAALQTELRTEGVQAAISALRASKGELDYLLTDAAGAPVVANSRLGELPLGWSSYHAPFGSRGAEGEDDFVFLSATTPDGGRLTIGDNLGRAEEIRRAVLNTLLWVGVGAVACVCVAGIFLARGATRRMDALIGTLVRVSAGDLSARAPQTRGNDDVDQIARGVNEMLARVDALVANTRRVSADIAHDLRTPLTHVQHLLEAASGEEEVNRDAIRAAQVKIDEVLRSFSAMLRLAEIEAGAGKHRFAQVNLASLVEGVGDAYRHDVEASGHPFHVVSAGEASMYGDADLLRQALSNLIENAMRHTMTGVPITLSVVGGAESVQLIVEDRGEGVRAADHAHVLSPFGRLDSARSTPGAGLGLSIVSAIARLHGAQFLLEDAHPGLRAIIQAPPSAQSEH